MTDHALATALAMALEVEGKTRTHWEASRMDLAERDSSLVALRQATALRRSLETWIGTRACRAALRHTHQEA